MTFRFRKGLSITLPGVPAQTLSSANPISSVAVLGQDYPGLRPALQVSEGDRVATGSVLFHDKHTPAIKITSPGAGRIAAITRGDKRRLVSISIDLDGDAVVDFPIVDDVDLARMGRDDVVSRLCDSGQWSAIRQRPYGGIADPNARPEALCVTAMDSNPLAPDPRVAISHHADAFKRGLLMLSRLCNGPCHLCTAPDADIPSIDTFQRSTFAGPHPAGLAGTHIHYLFPVGPGRLVWHVGYQDVIAMGYLVANGRLWTDRIIALGGEGVSSPRLVQTRLGASVNDIVAGELASVNPVRVISGSVLSGRLAVHGEAYLGRYHDQISVVADPPVTGTGGPGALVATEQLDNAMPLDILPTPLMRALVMKNAQRVARLGGVELIEEDVALLSYLCAGGHDYGALLRACLDELAKEGAL